MTTPKSSAERSRQFRMRQKEKGLRQVRFWVPDTRSPEFLEEARRECEAVNASLHATEDQAFVDALVEEFLAELPDE